MAGETVRLSAPIEIKLATGARAGDFEGYASTFNGTPDAYGDIIAPGAFSKSLAQHRANTTMPPLLWMHDIEQPIGAWSELAEDANGLKVKGKLTLGTGRGAEAYALLKDAKSALGMSIGYRTRSAGKDGAGNRILSEIDLLEISLVSLPANRAARITAIKSAGVAGELQFKSIREFEHFLRDAGVPKAAAAKLASGGWPSLDRRDADGTTFESLRKLISSQTAELSSFARSNRQPAGRQARSK